MKPKKIKRIVKAALDNLDREYELIYVAYDDRLSDKQIAAWFNADTEQGRFDVENEVYDVFDESRYTSMREAVKEAVEQGLRDLDLDDDLDAEQFIDDHPGECEKIEQEVYARDQSNPFKDLVRRTGSILVRCDAGNADVDNFDVPSAWASDDDDRTESIEGMAATLGVDLERNRAKLEELFDNAGGGYLQLIWYADVADLMAHDDNGNLPTRATLTDPYVLVIDTWNGAGHDVKVQGTITVDLANLRPDKGSGGYGWDAIAGVVHSAYTPRDVTYHYPVSLRKKAA